MAVSREPAQGVVRLSGVYTPPPRSESTAMRQPAFVLCRNIFAAVGIGAFSTLTRATLHRIPFTAELGMRPAEAPRYRFD
jgi:hypothetical protein